MTRLNSGSIQVELAVNYGFKAHELNEMERIINRIKPISWRHGMSTLAETNLTIKRTFRRAYVPQTALGQSIEFADDLMQVSLTDGRIISVPVIWFPLLHEATPEQRTRYEIGGGGVSLHWPEIDEDLAVASLLAGGDWQAA